VTSRLLVTLALLAAAGGALGQQEKSWGGWESDFDDEGKAWKEIEVRIPPYPEAGAMRQFEAGDGRGYRYYLDARSLSMGEDEVVRFTVAVFAPGGARNITYEGIRCEERSFRVYAIGHSDRSWVRARNSKWQHIAYLDVNNYRGVLFAELFCNNKLVKPLREIRQHVEEAPGSVINRSAYREP
jgi:CNP1-like family